MTDDLKLFTGRRFAGFTLVALSALLSAGPANAVDPVEKVVAVVNDEAISQGDLEGRLKLDMVSGNYPDNSEVRDRLTPQVIHQLVDEQLEMQEAKRLKLEVDPTEIEESLKRVAEQNNAPLEQFEKSLAKEGVPVSTLERQIRAQIAWSKVIQKEIRPRIDLSQEEIDAAYEKMLASVDKPQYLLAEIFLGVDNPAQENQVKNFAQQLEDQLHHGANFAALARQFSQAAGAASGGDLGAVQQGELPDELDQAMQRMSPGEVSAPIRTQSGYHILLLREKGSVLAGDPLEAKVQLKQVLLPFAGQPTQADAERLAAEAQQMRPSLPNCAAVDERAKRDPLSGNLGTPGQLFKIADLPRQIAVAVAPLHVNELSQPVVSPQGIAMLMVCQRQDPPRREPPSKDQVANQIGMERMDLQQQRYLRDLRSAAFVDIRV
jgi:peptidyl-prolyl cis-trans isomerase SurA